MANNLALQVTFLIYIISLAGLLYVSFYSKNELVKSFGLIYTIYSIGFLQPVFDFEFWSLLVHVAFSVEDYLRLLWLNFALTVIVLLVSRQADAGRAGRPHYAATLGYIFLGLGVFAMLNEVRYYGLQDFLFSDKALRFSGEFGSINNLFIISIDYLLFIIAGCYSLASVAKSNAGRNVFYLGMLLTAVIGYLQGFRYYLAALFVFAFLSLIKRQSRFSLLTVIGVVVAGLALAEAAKITLSWILWYEWVHDYGYANYFAMSYSGLVPQEVKAVATNTWLGFNIYADQLRPDLLGYLVKLIPFSERFYDFSSFDQLYSVLGQDMQLGAGQGTAFSFFLDSYVSYFFPVLLLWFALWLTDVHPTPIVKVIVLFFILNLIRNGFLVSIAALKLPLLIYALAYGGIAMLRAAAPADGPRYRLPLHPQGPEQRL